MSVESGRSSSRQAARRTRRGPARASDCSHETADGHDPARLRGLPGDRAKRHGRDCAHEPGRCAAAQGGPRRAPSLSGDVRATSRFAAASAAIASRSAHDERTSTGAKHELHAAERAAAPSGSHRTRLTGATGSSGSRWRRYGSSPTGSGGAPSSRLFGLRRQRSQGRSSRTPRVLGQASRVYGRGARIAR
jgi:hypothetical protein